MTKAELQALGLPDDKQKEFQRIYYRDLHRAAQRMAQEGKTAEIEELRDGIIAMIRLIPDPDRLRRILATANHQYMRLYQEIRDNPPPDTAEGKVDSCQ